jgi:repressor LexA
VRSGSQSYNPNRPLTQRQEQVLKAVKDFIAVNGYSPSTRDISKAVGLAVGGVSYQLRELELAGRIAMTPSVARSIRVLERTDA